MMATSVTMAVARGQVQVGGQIVICTGDGVVSVDVDAGGNPVGPAHICPDCVLSFMAFSESAPVGPVAPVTVARLVQDVVVVLPASRSLAAARARGPPLSV